MKTYTLFIALALATVALGQTNVEVKKAGMLAEVLTQEQKDTCSYLVVSGKLNSADIRVLRQMAGYAEEEGQSVGRLATLDLGGVEFVTDKSPYMVLDAAEVQLKATVVPTGSKSYSHMLGRPLAEDHEINYDRYYHKDWKDYRNYRWNGSFYVDRPELMEVTGKSTSYRPRYFIGKLEDMEKHVHPQHKTSSSSDTQHSKVKMPYFNGGQFCFASKDFGTADWKMMKRAGITHFRGHRVVKDGDRYLLEAFCQKGCLPHDMFHGCSSLQHVILPDGVRVDRTVFDETSTLEYSVPYDKVTILYINKKVRKRPYRTYDMGRYGIEKKVVLKGAEAEEVIEVLKGLKPTSQNPNYQMDTAARLFVEYADGSAPETFYHDIDESCVQEGWKGPYFETSGRLLDLLRAHGIPTSAVRKYKLPKPVKK